MNFLKSTVLVFSLFLFNSSAFAQSNQEEEVKQVIVNLFDAMRTSNKEALSNCFNENAMLETIYMKEGETKVHRSSAVEFVDGVTKEHKEVYNEVIKSYSIKIDGNMASVWAPYEFYLDDTLLHCGVNSIQLFKSNEGWKITYVLDTRRTKDCLD